MYTGEYCCRSSGNDVVKFVYCPAVLLDGVQSPSAIVSNVHLLTAVSSSSPTPRKKMTNARLLVLDVRH